MCCLRLSDDFLDLYDCLLSLDSFILQVGEGNGTPLQYSPGKSHGRKSLVGYSPWGRKELDTTE